MSTVDGSCHIMTPKKKKVSLLFTFCLWRHSPVLYMVLPVLFCLPMQHLCVHVCFEAHFLRVLNTGILSVLHKRHLLETCSLCAFALTLRCVSCLLLQREDIVSVGFLSERACLQKAESSHYLIKNINNVTFKLYFSEGDLCMYTCTPE